ncbi:hypothetical protein [Gynuella sp.]|uniref:hypothetical protein n=1 Tax=Gynuella sp. TaxID=2969146 RepID=UPI003D0F58BE
MISTITHHQISPETFAKYHSDYLSIRPGALLFRASTAVYDELLLTCQAVRTALTECLLELIRVKTTDALFEDLGFEASDSTFLK